MPFGGETRVHRSVPKLFLLGNSHIGLKETPVSINAKKVWGGDQEEALSFILGLKMLRFW